MTKKLVLFLLIFSTGLVSCKRQRISRQGIPVQTGAPVFFSTVSSLPDSLAMPAGFAYLSARSRISIRGKKQNIQNASVTLRMKRDSVIWLSASTMGLEVFRGVIATDGIRIIDRVNKLYTEIPYRLLAEKISFPVDYTLLQSFLLAEIPVYPGQGFEIGLDSTRILVRQADGYLAVLNLLDRLTKTTSAIEAHDLISHSKAYAEYNDFRQAGDGLVPGEITIRLSGRPVSGGTGEEQLMISLVHNSIHPSDSTLSFPFQVPNNYKKAF